MIGVVCCAVVEEAEFRRVEDCLGLLLLLTGVKWVLMRISIVYYHSHIIIVIAIAEHDKWYAHLILQ